MYQRDINKVNLENDKDCNNFFDSVFVLVSGVCLEPQPKIP